MDCTTEVLKEIEEKISNRGIPIEQVLKGRRKYDYKTLKPIKFTGYTTIYVLSKEEKETLDLVRVAEWLRQPLETVGLENIMAFVDPTFYHITTFDIIHQGRKKLIENEGVDFEDISKSIGQAAKDYLEQLPEYVFHGEINGITTFNGKNIVLKVNLNAEEHERIVKLRKELNSYLCNKIKEYQLIYGTAWEAEYHPHITISYTVNKIPQKKYNEFLRIINQAGERFKGKQIKFRVGNVYSFDNMDEFIPLE